MYPFGKEAKQTMNRINPFENYFDPNKISGAGNINAPEKIDGQNPQKEPEETQGISGLEQVDENDFVDASNMIDDSEGFNFNDFNNEDKNQGNEKDLEKASEMMNDFLNQKRN